MIAPVPGPARPAGGTRPVARRFVMAGVSHRTAGQELRDALFVEDAALPAFHRRLAEAGIEEAVVLATCDRVEVAAIAAEPEAAATRIRRALGEGAGLAPEMLEGAVVARTGTAALAHLFRIAASLESQVVGEPEVLGQVKEAHRRASELGFAGPALGRVMDAAYAAAKRARSETALGECAVSIVSAGCQAAREVLGSFEDRHALMIGGAEFGVAVIERLKGAGLREVTVADPLAPRAEALGVRLGAHRLAMEAVASHVGDFDMILTGLGGRAPVVRAADVARALKARRFRPIFLLDAAVPPDVEKGVRAIDDAYLFDLHDLERIALAGQEQRGQAAEAAGRIVEEEVAAFVADEGGRAAVPAVSELRAHFEDVRAELLRERPGLTAEEATRLLVNRLLHAPSRALREIAAEEGAVRRETRSGAGLLARLFGLGSRRGDGGR